VSKQLVRVATGASSPRQRVNRRVTPRECPRALSNEKPTTKRCLRRCDRGVSSACPSHGALSFRLNFQRAALHWGHESERREQKFWHHDAIMLFKLT
jgi:hypothetical protein